MSDAHRGDGIGAGSVGQTAAADAMMTACWDA